MANAQVEENKRLMRRFVEELLNTGNLDLVDAFFDAHCTMRNPAAPDLLRGTNEVKNYLSAVFEAFPDFHITIEEMIAEQTKVAARVTISGTFQGDFAGVPANGKHTTWSGTSIWRIVDGKIVKGWEELDLLGAYQRLGILPSPQ